MDKVTVLFVCLGNICRSPSAQGVFQHLIDQKGLGEFIHVDSAGTSAWHIDSPPDPRSVREAEKKGYDLRALRGRQVTREDFQLFDFILAMDEANLADLEELRPPTYSGHLGLFLAFSDDQDYTEVPDPYHGGGEGFRVVLDLLENASQGLLQAIENKLPPG